MSYSNINGAQIYYETYGVDPRGQPAVPLLLIHGAGSTGQADWGEVAPLLARHGRVIAPDCRGHGRSTNPGHSYRFREMAEDLAELIGRLGYARTHIVGHGSGGNVALVLLLEHSEVVQTCTLQAANAYVSPDILESLWRWQPDRVSAETPEWAHEMAALHAPIHGRDYWRELWELTLAETARQPAYTADDLALAARPVLVIQGALDRINAPGTHGQYLARHIPGAEWWFPAGAGHAVHHEKPWAWVERLLDFLDRRGDDANAALDRLRRTVYTDRRQTVFSVRAALRALHPEGAGQPTPQAKLPALMAGSEDSFLGADDPVLETEILEETGTDPNLDANAYAAEWCLELTGQTLREDQHQAALAVAGDVRQVAGLASAVVVDDRVRVLLGRDTQRAVSAVPLADLHEAPEPNAPRISQVLAGETLQVLEERDDWAFVRLEGDGYLGWVEGGTLHRCEPGGDEGPMQGDAMVIAEIATAYARPSGNARPVGRLPCGVTLPRTARQGRWAALRLPHGDEWWVRQANLLALAELPQPNAAGIAWALGKLRHWAGVPYMAGGRTALGLDAAGLAQVFLRLIGVPAPRAADQQFAAGRPVAGRPRPGDLVFFAHESAGNDDPRPQRPAVISHVAISLGGYRLLQAGGGALNVNVISIGRPRTPAARWLRGHLAGVRRYVADDGATTPATEPGTD